VPKFKQSPRQRRRSSGRETPTLLVEDISNWSPERNAQTEKMGPPAKEVNNNK